MAKSSSNHYLGPHPKYPKSVQPGIPRLQVPKQNWQTVRIGELFREVGRPVRMDDNVVYDLVTVKRSRGGVELREKLTGKQIAVKSQFHVCAGDFLISKRQIVHGACGFVPKELDGAIVSNEYAVLRCTDKILPEFLEHLIHTIYFQQTCFHSSIGVHVEKMIFKLSVWYEWEINIPNSTIQSKIAAFLGAVDEKLAALRRKRELLAEYKRGVMQQIFSQQIRFTQDDGRPFPDWEMKRLKDVATRLTAKNIEENINRVLTNSATLGVLAQHDYFDKEIANANNLRGYYIVEDGDYVYNPRISVHAPVGPINKNKVGKGVMSPLYSIFRFHNSKNTFYEQYFQTTLWHKYMRSVANFGARHDRMNITTADFMNLPLPLPAKDEQEKIANFIFSLAKKVDGVDKQIEKITAFKKGLLQQMFV